MCFCDKSMQFRLSRHADKEFGSAAFAIVSIHTFASFWIPTI